MRKELYRQLTYVLGEIHQWKEEAPDIYYLNVLHPEAGPQEYYVVLPDAPISQEARSLGNQLEGTPALAYLFDSGSGAQSVVDYEILRYKTMHSLPLPEGASLLETAHYGMEQCPNYFGIYPIPPVTPWGFTLRHRPLDNGIYWIETDKCLEVLAICRPVWDSELSDGLLNLGKRMEHEGEMGYLYFERKLACVVLFELLWT